MVNQNPRNTRGKKVELYTFCLAANVNTHTNAIEYLTNKRALVILINHLIKDRRGPSKSAPARPC